MSTDEVIAKAEIKYYLVRHGETAWNKEERMLSFTDIPLTEQGIEQAKELAGILNDIQIQRIFSSDMSRTRKTAEIIRGERRVPLISSPRLREKNFGILEGLTLKKVIALDSHAEVLSENEKFTYKYHPSMENDQEVFQRVITFLREAQSSLYKTTLIVSHSSVMRAFLIGTKNATYETLPHSSINNCSSILFTLDKKEGIKILKISRINFKK